MAPPPITWGHADLRHHCVPASLPSMGSYGMTGSSLLFAFNSSKVTDCSWFRAFSSLGELGDTPGRSYQFQLLLVCSDLHYPEPRGMLSDWFPMETMGIFEPHLCPLKKVGPGELGSGRYNTTQSNTTNTKQHNTTNTTQQGKTNTTQQGTTQPTQEEKHNAVQQIQQTQINALLKFRAVPRVMPAAQWKRSEILALSPRVITQSEETPWKST